MPPGEIAQPAEVLTPLTSDSADVIAPVSYSTERIDGTVAVVACIAQHEAACSALAFQRLAWLKPLYESLAPDLSAQALAIVMTDAASGELAAVLPLVITREGSISTVSWASLGVSDYGAPMLGAMAPANARDAQALWNEVKRVLSGCDLLQLSNMPGEIAGRVNPFALIAPAHTSRHARHALTLEGTVEHFLASRGKKYRKEAERCTRLLTEKGEPQFHRAETGGEITEAFAALEAQQASRHASRGKDYQLGQRAYARFFEAALRAGVPGGAVHIFTLRAGGEIGAVLYGIAHEKTFTLLRISTGGDAWKRVSPGRLIVLETMRYFLSKGITTFDMGIGDYDFKQGFGVKAEPLYDAVSALSVWGLRRTASARVKAKARQYPGLVDAAKRLMGRA